MQELAKYNQFCSIQIDKLANLQMPEECRYLSLIQLRNLCSFSGMASSQSDSFQEAAKEAVSYLFKLNQGVARMWFESIQGWLGGHLSEFY